MSTPRRLADDQARLAVIGAWAHSVGVGTFLAWTLTGLLADVPGWGQLDEVTRWLEKALVAAVLTIQFVALRQWASATHTHAPDAPCSHVDPGQAHGGRGGDAR